MFSCVFPPNPLRPATRSSSIAATSSGTDATPSSWYSTMAFFGPRPGIDISSRTPGGIWARSASRSANVPVWSSSTIFSPIDLPTFGICRMPFRSSVETSAW